MDQCERGEHFSRGPEVLCDDAQDERRGYKGLFWLGQFPLAGKGNKGLVNFLGYG